MEFPVCFLNDKTEDFNMDIQPCNTGTLMAAGSDWLKQLGMSELVSEFRVSMMSGTYEDALDTMDKWFDLDLRMEYALWQELRYDD